MRLILLNDIGRLGKWGDVVDVKPGYGRNYLIPNKLALLYTQGNLHKFEHLKKMAEVRLGKTQKTALQLKERLESISLTFPAQAGEDGKLFGSVTNIDLQELLANEGIVLERKNIILEPIKELGVYSVKVLLQEGIEAIVKLWVVNK